MEIILGKICNSSLQKKLRYLPKKKVEKESKKKPQK